MRSLPALLAARAESAPAAPWLIYRDRLDWAWHSCAQVADRVARLAAGLKVAPGRPVPVDGRLDPTAIAVDIGVQACGGVATASAAVTETGDPVAVRSRLDRWQPTAIDLRLAARSAAEVVVGGQPVALDPAALWARCACIDEQWQAGRTVEKPVALICGTLRDPGVRSLVAWTLVRGAALALEPDAALAAQAVSWVRPHVAVVPRGAIDAVCDAVVGQKKRWRRLVLLGISEEPGPDSRSEPARQATEPGATVAASVASGDDFGHRLGVRWLRTAPSLPRSWDPRDSGEGDLRTSAPASGEGASE